MADLLKLVGARIRALRKDKGWSQERLAELAELNASYVGKIERGEKNVTFKSLEKVSASLGITIEELFQNIQTLEDGKDAQTLATIMVLLQNKSDQDQKKALQLLELVLNWNK